MMDAASFAIGALFGTVCTGPILVSIVDRYIELRNPDNKPDSVAVEVVCEDQSGECECADQHIVNTKPQIEKYTLDDDYTHEDDQVFDDNKPDEGKS